jgi:hypothetical protein
MFGALRIQVEESKVTTWLTSDIYDPGFRILTEEEICELVQHDDSAEREEEERMTTVWQW